MIAFLLIVLTLAAVFVLICYWAYDYSFKSHKIREAMEYEVPDCDFKPKVLENILELINTPFEFVNITSFDGLNLSARYYHFGDGAPLAIMFHGYRSNYCRDGNGGFKLLRDMGFNILLPDQRAHGKSEGRIISFGINERKDCLSWVNYITKRFGDEIEIVLVGVSMGASTVMMASDIVPKENVKAIVADCGYTSPADIIRHVSRKMRLPGNSGYFFARLGARMFAKLDTEAYSCPKALASTQIPVCFIHGEADGFVPCEMSHACFEACASYKEILTVPGAGHGTSYYIDGAKYTEKVCSFLRKFVKISK